MKTSIFIAGIIFIACSSSKKNNTTAIDKASISKDSVPSLPSCIEKMIAQYKSEEKQNPPRRIFSYSYKGKTVYYVTAPCCDFFSDLYDSTCVLIGHPDGGFTGKGDGNMNDFKDLRTNEKLVWGDERK